MSQENDVLKEYRVVICNAKYYEIRFSAYNIIDAENELNAIFNNHDYTEIGRLIDEENTIDEEIEER